MQPRGAHSAWIEVKLNRGIVEGGAGAQRLIRTVGSGHAIVGSVIGEFWIKKHGGIPPSLGVDAEEEGARIALLVLSEGLLAGPGEEEGEAAGCFQKSSSVHGLSPHS
jgi:hypothetical protein